MQKLLSNILIKKVKVRFKKVSSKTSGICNELDLGVTYEIFTFFDGPSNNFLILSLIYSDQFTQRIGLDKILEFWQKNPWNSDFICKYEVSVNMKTGSQWKSFWKWISIISLILHCNHCVHIHNELACDDLYLFSWEELLLSGLSSWGNKKISAKSIPYFYAVYIALRHICIEFY